MGDYDDLVFESIQSGRWEREYERGRRRGERDGKVDASSPSSSLSRLQLDQKRALSSRTLYIAYQASDRARRKET